MFRFYYSGPVTILRSCNLHFASITLLEWKWTSIAPMGMGMRPAARQKVHCSLNKA